MKPRRILSVLLLSLGLILLTFAATCRLVMTNIQIDYDPSSPATVTLTVMETITDLTASRIVSHTVPNCTVIVTAFPDEHVETVGYTEVKPEMLDALALHQPKPTAASLAEFAKLAESGTITRSQFETFAYHAVNSPLPNENFTDLNALADTLRKALDEGTQIIL